MPVYIDSNICDRSKACPAVASCVPQALQYDAQAGAIKCDPEKCKDCGICLNNCGMRALHLYKNEDELAVLQKELARLKSEERK